MRSRTVAIVAAAWLAGLAAALPGADAACTVPGVVGCPPPPSQPTPPPPPAAPTPPATPAPGAQPSPQPAPAPNPAAVEARLLELVNRDRRAAGLAPLTRRSDLDSFARGHSGDMARANTLWHNDAFFTPAAHDRFDSKTHGENVAMNPGADDMHRRLMNSPAHRANILDGRFRVVGIGVVHGSSGSYFATQNFIEPRAAAPRPVTQAKRPAKAVRASTVAAPGAVVPVPVAAAPAPDRLPWAGAGLTTRLPAEAPAGGAGGFPTPTLAGFSLLSLLSVGGVVAKRSIR